MPDPSTDALKYDQTTHFGFGENWAAYSRTVTDEDIANAMRQMQRLLGRDDLTGLSFFDIGCGSGIHALAALKLGAARVVAIDIDASSVATAREMIGSRWTQPNVDVRQDNIFKITPQACDRFDIVYSWGVLHHTGDMWDAIRRAAEFVADGGIFALALYRKTKMCGFWQWEKHRFTHGGRIFRGAAIGTYVGARVLRDLAHLKNPRARMRGYTEKRGMKWYTDVIDWLGGYPYESASAEEVTDFLQGRGFRLKQAFRTRSSFGLLGSGNAEYVFERLPAPPAITSAA